MLLDVLTLVLARCWQVSLSRNVMLFVIPNLKLKYFEMTRTCLSTDLVAMEEVVMEAAMEVMAEAVIAVATVVDTGLEAPTMEVAVVDTETSQRSQTGAIKPRFYPKLMLLTHELTRTKLSCRSDCSIYYLTRRPYFHVPGSARVLHVINSSVRDDLILFLYKCAISQK